MHLVVTVAVLVAVVVATSAVCRRFDLSPPLVLVANAALLSLYTLSCHSCRHLCGGCLDAFKQAPTRYRLWSAVSRLNERHGLFAWISLFGVAFADLYVRLVAMGVITDPRIIF